LERRSIHGARRRIGSHPIRDLVRGETVESASAFLGSGMTPPSIRISAMALTFFQPCFFQAPERSRRLRITQLGVAISARFHSFELLDNKSTLKQFQTQFCQSHSR
jgi:hypothetical protein